MNKDVQQLARHIRQRGYRLKHGGSHLNILSAEGNVLFAIPKTPSDHRWYRNAVTDLVRLGVLDGDPKKEGQRKRAATSRNGGGVSPPPALGPLTERNGMAATATKRAHHDLTTKEIDRASVTLQRIAIHYGLTPRKSRTVAHGAQPILAAVIEAYAREAGKEIPAFNYKVYDTTDVAEMARLCADRVGGVAIFKAGHSVSLVTVESVEFAEKALAWFENNRDWKFPDGYTLEVNYRGVTFTRPEPPAPDEVIDVEGSTYVLADVPDYQAEVTAALQRSTPQQPPLSFRTLAALVGNGMDQAEAMQLAMEVARLETK